MATENKFQTVSLGKKSVVLEKDAALEQKYIDQRLKAHKDYYESILDSETKLEKEIERLHRKGDHAAANQREKELSKLTKSRMKAEAELAEARISIEADAASVINKKALNEYKNLTIQQRREHSKRIYEELKEEVDKFSSLKSQHDSYVNDLTAKKEKASKKEKEAIQKLIDEENVRWEKQKKNQEELNNQLIVAKQATDGLAKSAAKSAGSLLNKGLSLLDKPLEKHGKSPIRADFSGLNSDVRKSKGQEVGENLKKEIELQKKLNKIKAEGHKNELDAATLKNKLTEEENKFREENNYQSKTTLKDSSVELAKEVGAGIANTVGDVLDDLADKLTDIASIDETLDDILGDQARNMARLQGSTVDWRKTVDEVSDSIGMSGIASKRSVIKKMSELVDSGVAYNLELRAFISEMSDKIAYTFEAFDSNLLRMIRLQQADTTAARLGLEATLTKLFNSKFQDTSYLKETSDNVTAAIMDSSALMKKEESLVYEYTVQKWLGSLYSLGASSNVVTTIAEGLNMLATGQLPKLASNSTLMTLFGLSDSGALAKISDKGITAKETNDLLYKMFLKLSDISSNQTSLVVKSAWADLLGMSITDLSTFSSITREEVNSLYKSTTTYNSLLDETETQLKQVKKRMSLSEMVDNAVDNALVGVASNIGSTALGYGTWKALAVLKDYVGEVNLPSVLAAGFGLSSDIDLLNVAQTGIAGMSLITELISGLKNLGNGPSKLSSWNFEETTERGGGVRALSEGVEKTTSTSAVLHVAPSVRGLTPNVMNLLAYRDEEEGYNSGIGNMSSKDIENVSFQSAADKAYESSGITSNELREGQDLTQKIYDAIAGNDTLNIINLLSNINEKFDTSNANLRVLYEINDDLEKIKVNYTSISSNSYYRDSYSAISTLSSELSTMKNPLNHNDDNRSSSSEVVTSSQDIQDSSITGKGKFMQDFDIESLEEIIASAVAEGIRQYSFANKMPVEMTYTGGTY